MGACFTCPCDHTPSEIVCDCDCHEAAEALSRVALTPAGRRALVAEHVATHWADAFRIWLAIRSTKPWARVAREAGKNQARAENCNEVAEAYREDGARLSERHAAGRAHAYLAVSVDLRALARELRACAS